MKIAVCDDDRPIREELIRLIQRQVTDADITEYQSGEEWMVFTFRDGKTVEIKN